VFFGNGNGNGNGNGETVKILLPEIVSFTANPSSIIIGRQATLMWETKNAEVKIEPLGKTVKPSARINVRPRKTTTYTLIARNKEGKEVRKNVTVKVKVSVAPRPELREIDPRIMRQRDHRKILEDQRPKTLR